MHARKAVTVLLVVLIASALGAGICSQRRDCADQDASSVAVAVTGKGAHLECVG